MAKSEKLSQVLELSHPSIILLCTQWCHRVLLEPVSNSAKWEITPWTAHHHPLPRTVQLGPSWSTSRMLLFWKCREEAGQAAAYITWGSTTAPQVGRVSGHRRAGWSAGLVAWPGERAERGLWDMWGQSQPRMTAHHWSRGASGSTPPHLDGCVVFPLPVFKESPAGFTFSCWIRDNAVMGFMAAVLFCWNSSL